MIQIRLFEDMPPVLRASGLWLSRLELDPRSRRVRQDLSDCHALHRRVMSAFPESREASARQLLGVLYRLEADARRNRLVLLVQSQVAPDWSQLPSDRNGQPFCLTESESKPIDDHIRVLRGGQRLLFRLRANPTKRKSSGKQSGRRGKPLAVFGEENQLAWLQRQGAKGGFRVLSARVRPDNDSFAARAPHNSVGWQQGRKNQAVPRTREGEPALAFGVVVYEGELAVTDADIFRNTLAGGIGRGKAYGCGLLSIAPAAA